MKAQPHRRRSSKVRRRAGLPDPASVTSVVDFTSPAQKRYRILKTTECDAYDRPAKRGSRRRDG